MSFDTLLSEFVVVRCRTLSMLVKARWASPIHSFCCCVGRVDRYWLRARGEKQCDVARLSVRLGSQNAPFSRVRLRSTREVLHTALRER